MCREQVGHLLIELAEVILDQAQFVERELQQPAVDRMQRRARLEGIAQLGRCGSQARGRKGREGRRISFAIRQGLQHDTGHLDVRLLDQRLQSVVKLHAVPGDLILAPHHGAPKPLLDVGDEAQVEFLRDQTFHQPFGIREVLLAGRRARDSIVLAPDGACPPGAPRRRGHGVGAASAVRAPPTPAASTVRSTP